MIIGINVTCHNLTTPPPNVGDIPCSAHGHSNPSQPQALYLFGEDDSTLNVIGRMLSLITHHSVPVSSQIVCVSFIPPYILIH